jgi:hypothetical protein
MTGEVDIPRGPLGATVKRVQQLAARPLVAFVSLFGDRDDVPRRELAASDPLVA